MSQLVDLRSDTVTRPTAGMRAAMAAAPLGDDVFGDDPSVNALQEKIAAMLGLRGGAVRADRNAEQPVRHAVALPARRRVHRRPDAALLPLGRRRRGGVRQRAAAAAGPPAGRHAGAGRHRSRHQAGRSAFRAHPPAGAGEHAGRQGAAVRLPASRRRRWRVARAWPRHLDGARLFNAAVAQAARSAAAMRAREARRIAALLRQRLGVLQQGPGRAGRLGAVRLARADRPRPAHPQDGRRRDAPGRHAGGGGLVRAGPPCRPPGARTMRWRGGWPQGLGGIAALQVEPPQTNILFVDLVGAAKRAVRRAAGAPGARRRAGHRPVPAALRHPPGCGCGGRRPRRRCHPALLPA